MKSIKQTLYFTPSAVLAAFICVSMLFASCAKPPTDEMEQAEAAVTRAENDPDARQHAQNSITRARDSLNNMHSEAEQKHYEQAKQLASDTIALAERAISDGKAAAARVRDEADNAIRAMENLLTETQATIENARNSNRAALNFSEIDSDFATANSVANQAREANGTSNYSRAIDLSNSVRTTLSNITAKIGQAAQAQNRKK
jgi:hypothetical protein